jgi:hypothetical protein
VTEDKDVTYLSRLLESSGLKHGEYDTWSYEGSSKLGAAGILSAFSAQHAPGTKVFVHRDRDYIDDAEILSYEEDIREAGAVPFITEGTDVENYFLSIDHLSVIYPEIDPAQLEDILERATASTRGHSIKLMVNARVEFGNAQRRLGVKPNPPSAGTVAARTPADFDGRPHRFRHGKKTLGQVQSLIQKEHGLNRSVAKVSAALSIPLFTQTG